MNNINYDVIRPWFLLSVGLEKYDITLEATTCASLSYININ